MLQAFIEHSVISIERYLVGDCLWYKLEVFQRRRLVIDGRRGYRMFMSIAQT